MEKQGLVWFKRLAVLMAFAGATGTIYAGSYSNDFSVASSGILFGTAVRSPGGGLANNGLMALTTGNPNSTGSFIIAELDVGELVAAFTAEFKVYAFGSSPTGGEGYSFNFASNLPGSAFGEQGAGTGLTISFDTLDSGGGEAPAIDVFYNGSLVTGGHAATSPRTGDALVQVFVELHPDGTLDLLFGGNTIFDGLATGYIPSGGNFGWGARTGLDRHWVDDVVITTTIVPEPSSVLLVALGIVGLIGFCKR